MKAIDGVCIFTILRFGHLKKLWN